MPPNLPRKRTFASTSAYESDAENGYASGRTRRQRTSSTTAIETARAPISISKPNPSFRILNPAAFENKSQDQSLTVLDVADTTATAKTRPAHLSAIPRPVAFKAHSITNTGGQKTPGSSTKSLLALSTVTKASSAAPLVVKALKLKEHWGCQKNGGDSVSNPPMDRLLSIPSPPANPPSKSASRAHPKRPQESVLSDSKGAVAFPTSEPARATRKPEPPPARPLPSKPLNAKRERKRPATVFSEEVKLPQAYTDAEGFAHLSALDCQLFLSFINSPHHEIWDVPDSAIIPCPAFLYIMAKDLSAWENVPLSIPDVTVIDVRCRTKPYPSRVSCRHSDSDNWECKFDGHELPTSSDSIIPSTNLPHGTISLEMKWERVSSMPTNGLNIPVATASPEPSPPPTALDHLPFFRTTDAPGPLPDDSKPKLPGRGWCKKLWIPVPAHLFMRKETRTFEIDAEVFIMPGVDGRMVDLTQITESVSTHTEMTVSHLRTEREMDFF